MAQIIIEIGDKKNSSFIWGPTQDKVRGRFSVHNMPHGSTSARGITSIPDLPGHQIMIDTASKRGVIIDPLLTEQYADIYREAKRVFKEAKGIDFFAIPKREYDKLSDIDVNTWLYWMKRLVDQNQATVRKGGLPTEITGKYKTNFFDTSAFAETIVGGDEAPAS